MDYSASKYIGDVFNALWPHLVETIGAAVDGDPTKIRVLQEAPYSVMQMQSVRSAGNHGPATNSNGASSSALPSQSTTGHFGGAPEQANVNAMLNAGVYRPGPTGSISNTADYTHHERLPPKKILAFRHS